MMKLNVVRTILSKKRLGFKIFLGLVVLLVIWVQGAKLFGSGGFDKNGNLIFFGEVLFHDSNVHLSLISEILQRFPPTNFTSNFEGIQTLKNYHYLYDVLLAIVVKFTGISIFDIYFRVSPVITSLFLCIAIYLVAFKLTKDKIISVYAIFFTIFSTSFGSTLLVIKNLFNGRTVTGGSNIFMTDQIMDMLVNPHGALSLVLFLVLTIFIDTNLILFAVFLGLSFGLKAYGGIVFAAAAVVASIYGLFMKHNWRLLIAMVFGLGLMVVLILKTVSLGVAGLAIAPGWLLEKMMIELDRVNEPQYILLLQHYLTAGNILREAILYMLAFLVYLFGSLGLRVFGFFTRFKLDVSGVFLVSGMGISFLIPIFFNQSKKAYDIVQFTPYFTLGMGIFFTIALFDFLKRIKSINWRVIILSSVVVLTLFMNIKELETRFGVDKVADRVVISRDVIESANFIKKLTPPDAVFLLTPSDFNFRFSWFTSLTGRRCVYCGRGFAYQIGVNTVESEKRVRNIFEGKDSFSNFDYVYLEGEDRQKFARIEELYSLKKMFTNEKVTILKKT